MQSGFASLHLCSFEIILLCSSFCLSLACTTCTLLALSSFLCLLSSSLLVCLLSLALLKTLCDCLAASTEDSVDRVLSVVVCRDWEINLVRVRVCIADSEYRDSQTLCLSDSDVLLGNIDNEECRRETCQVGDRTEVLLKLRTLA